MGLPFLAALGVLVLLETAVRFDGRRRPTLDAEAREYVRLAVALGERDPDSLDFYAGPADLVADVRSHPPALADIQRSADAAFARLEGTAVAPEQVSRRQHLIRELRALRTRAALLLGQRPPYDVESEALFGAIPGRPDDRRFAQIRSRVDNLVPAAAGRLVDRYAAYEKQFIVERQGDKFDAKMAAQLRDMTSKQEQVIERLKSIKKELAECRRRTIAHVHLPLDETSTVEYVGNRPWGAYSRYQGKRHSVISVNIDFRFTVDRLLQTACHEGYPGHHVRNVLREAAHPGELEYTVQPLFSPDTFVAEGSAMYAAEIAFSEADRMAFVHDDLFPAAGIDGEDAARYLRIARLVGDLQEIQVEIARKYLNGELEFVRAASALEDEALMRETAPTLKYINEFRSYVTAYTTGRQAAVAAVDACAGPDDRERRWKCFERLLTADAEIALPRE